jgi:hypothetical protein
LEVCEGKKAKERTWDSASLGAKTLRDYAKEQLREVLKNSESRS